MAGEFSVTTASRAARYFAWTFLPCWQPCRRCRGAGPHQFRRRRLNHSRTKNRRYFKGQPACELMVGWHARVCQKVGSMSEMAIRTEQLTRRFGSLAAVDSIDLQVEAGQFFGLLGPNGAGKSTTIKMLTGLLAPTSGRMELLGLDFQRNPIDVKRQIGVVPEGMGLFERLTGAEYLHFVGRMYGLDHATTLQRTQELLEFMQLADRPKSMIADYSHGMQKKLALAAAVIHGPRILFLDEPFEGVDALAAGALKALLSRMTARGVTIFLTSHVLEIVERLCSHVGIIHQGRLVAQGSIEELRAGIAGEEGSKTTLEQIFLSIVGQNGAEQTRLEELSWLT